MRNRRRYILFILLISWESIRICRQNIMKKIAVISRHLGIQITNWN